MHRHGIFQEQEDATGTMHQESIYSLIPPAQAVIEKSAMHRSMVRRVTSRTQ